MSRHPRGGGVASGLGSRFVIRAPALLRLLPLPGPVFVRQFSRRWFSFSIFPFSLVYIALGAIPGSPRLRVLTALHDLSTSRASIFSTCIFVDALVAIYKIRVLVRYVCTRYVGTKKRKKQTTARSTSSSSRGFRRRSFRSS